MRTSMVPSKALKHGARFDFVEHPDLDDDQEPSTGEAAVAGNYGLDRRN
ncbi:MAG: hypothetical protein ACR2RD_07970 [Woeseiaceae bacterium]